MARNIFLALSIVTFAFGLTARSEIDLTSKNKSLGYVPVTNQENFHICYSLTVQQATDAYFHTYQLTTNKYISSVAMITLEYKDNILKKILGLETDLDGGKVCHSFKKSIQKNGSCPSLNVDQYLSRFYSSKYGKLKTLKYSLRDLGRIYTRYHSKRKQSLRSSHDQLLNDSINHILVLLYTAGFSKEKISKRTLSSAFRKKNRVLFLNHLLSPFCKGQRVLAPKLRCKKVINLFRNKYGRRRYIKKIKRKLYESKALPVMISYCSNLLKKGHRYKGLKNKKKCGFHASLIAGHRTRNGHDEFLIRNSWGEDCSVYHSDWECKNGNIWVRADSLVKNITDFNYLRHN